MWRCGECVKYGIGLCPMGEKWGRPRAPAPMICFLPDLSVAGRDDDYGDGDPRSRRVGETGEGVRP